MLGLSKQLDLHVCLYVNTSFVFYPIAQHRKRLESKSLKWVELSLALSGYHSYLICISIYVLQLEIFPHTKQVSKGVYTFS